VLDQIKPFTDLLDKIGNFVLMNCFGFITQLPGQLSGGNSGGRGPGGGGGGVGPAPIINFNAPIDSVSAGREVARVLADYSRSNGGR
jgi:hypothetical protein